MNLADTEFAQLTDFQRSSVHYVLDRFHGTNPTSRFLVADEVGMGKTLVARGVIAGTIDRLQRSDSGIDRIDILYICSNANIARQNISKLDVLGEGTRPISTRITLLATHLNDLNRPREDGKKIVNLVALTPGTSFQKGHAGGRAEERALLVHLTQPLLRGDHRRRALRALLRGDVSTSRWRSELRSLEQTANRPDPEIGRTYRALLGQSPLFSTLRRLIDRTVGETSLPAELRAARNSLVSDLRHLLARASVTALEPDLIILDEFQRFRHLLEEPEEGEESEVSQLARDLFEYRDAKVLLLSATPYKLFTLAEEQELTGDDHYRDFLATVSFLAHPDSAQTVAALGHSLGDFRSQLIAGGDPVVPRDQAQDILRSVMCRTERPTLGECNLLQERVGDAASPTADDLVSFVQMKRLSSLVDGALSVDYWKSSPYFINFMDGYQMSRRVRAQVGDSEVRASTKAIPHIRPGDVRNRRKIEPGNARLRALQDEIIGSELHHLLWMPPSMPYWQGTGAYSKLDGVTATKRLIFSSWAAAPSSIAALLSHEAVRSLAPKAGALTSARLTYNVTENQPQAMTTLLLTVPHPGLADMTDPLTVARRSPGSLLSAEEVLAETETAVSDRLPPSPPPSQGLSPDTWYWHAPTTWEGALSSYSDLRAVVGRGGADATRTGLGAHLERADDAVAGAVGLGAHPNDLARWVAMVGMVSPANCAWRSLRRVAFDSGRFSDEAIESGATLIGEGFRTLFNRPEVMSLLDSVDSAEPYWQRVLEYCLAGDLQAVLDEYFHHLIGNASPTNDVELLELADTVARIVAFGRGRVEAFNPLSPGSSIRFNTRFALRYGNARGTLAKDDESAERASDVQAAFNSPFWPFVLASTSVGQEGVDFHWWCHSLVHWNQPANVVDLEQREGRVHRFKGHAVRKNVAAAHRTEALRSKEADPWKAAFAAASDRRPADMNDLWPSWVYPGEAKVECWVPYLPLSKEQDRERRLRRDRALYRLAFGQPRQEDLLAVLEAGSVDPDVLKDLRIDLQPPAL
ncbi:MAG: helicase [Acidimicrobiia bacterium]